ncbi:MAG: hypothetical protein AAF499_07720 [Pseudomonadota bacterium]
MKQQVRETILSEALERGISLATPFGLSIASEQPTSGQPEGQV